MLHLFVSRYVTIDIIPDDFAVLRGILVNVERGKLFTVLGV
jgi:hypothetical protein